MNLASRPLCPACWGLVPQPQHAEPPNTSIFNDFRNYLWFLMNLASGPRGPACWGLAPAPTTQIYPFTRISIVIRKFSTNLAFRPFGACRAGAWLQGPNTPNPQIQFFIDFYCFLHILMNLASRPWARRVGAWPQSCRTSRSLHFHRFSLFSLNF